MKNFITKFFKLFGWFLLLFVVGSGLEGVVLSFLWEWFVVPVGLQPVSVLHAIGICIIIDFITYHYYDYKKSEEVGWAVSVLYIIIRPVVAMSVGALVHFNT